MKNETSAHLTDFEIERYRKSALSPHELLNLDDHLFDCENCRLRIGNSADLKTLYDSFFEDIKPKEPLGARIRNFWRFGHAFLFWPRVLAASVILLISLASLFFIFTRERNIDEARALPAKPPREEAKEILHQKESSPIEAGNLTPSNGDEKLAVSNEKNAEKKKDFSRNSPIEKEIARISKPKPTSTHERPASPKLQNTNLNELRIMEPEKDESQTLGEGDNKDEGPALEMRAIKTKHGYSINMSPIDRAEYEYYLAELPKFKTLIRMKSNSPNWKLPVNKLVAGRRYILQVTAIKDGEKGQSIKKEIVLGKSGGNKFADTIPKR